MPGEKTENNQSDIEILTGVMNNLKSMTAEYESLTKVVNIFSDYISEFSSLQKVILVNRRAPISNRYRADLVQQHGWSSR